MKLAMAFALFALLGPTVAPSQKGVLGEWTTPNGSVVNIYQCGKDVCLKVVAISKQAPSRVDGENPKRALRKRPLCGLEIGHGFHMTSPDHAEDGQLYDPESGNTYRGWMTADGNTLHLRGYIGLSIFGRTETWMRAQGDVAPCRA
ncbi:MAG TPA: DUF2147 domain-containing protein [Acidobacteriaceae bacterium]|nr:DUF2147 domain-containing protein [Acidobacteriaceae bacterium]